MTWTSRVLVLVAVLSPSVAGAAESPTAEQARQAAEVRKKLASTIEFPGIDANTKLEDALDLLTKISGVRFEINEQAFAYENTDSVTEKPLGRAIAKAGQITAEKVLRRILDRVTEIAATRPTFAVRGGVVEITTRFFASPADWHRPADLSSDGAGPRPATAPEVSIAFDKRELQDALQEIADASGVNVVLDTKAREKGKTAVTATANNAAVDTVVRLLADMADLQAVTVDDIIYVTTKENAKALREEKARMMKAEDAAPARPPQLGQ